MTATEILKECADSAEDWFTIAPRYRTKANLEAHILETVIKVLNSEHKEFHAKFNTEAV